MRFIVTMTDNNGCYIYSQPMSEADADELVAALAKAGIDAKSEYEEED